MSDTDTTTDLVAERTVTMMLMHTIIGLVASIADDDDTALSAEFTQDMRNFVDRITVPADIELLAGTSVMPAQAVAKAQARAHLLIDAIRIGIDQAIANRDTGTVN